jgi:hypothetical protein
MRCKTCDYPLWNLKARQCPECGAAFEPDEFEFVVNSVRFCCLHCDQSYYGTGPRGHLVPREFNCVKCGRRVSMNEMVLRPAQGVEEQQTQVERMPWLDRTVQNRFRRWVGTIGMALVAPGRLMRTVPEQSRTLQAWSFAILTHFVVAIVAVLPLMCLMGVPLVTVGGGRTTTMASRMAVSSLVSGGMLFVTAVVLSASWGLTVHLILRLTGTLSAGLGRTYQAICYSSGANVTSAVPCLGLWLGWIWWVISAVFMVRDAQRVSGGRAALAVLPFPLLIAIAAGGGYFSLVYFAMSAGPAGNAPFAMNQFASSETQIVTANLFSYATLHNGNWPGHAAELCSFDRNFPVGSFIVTGSNTDESLVPVGDTNLGQLPFLPPNKCAMAVQRAASALPSDVAAHRLGDFVFTYHGIDSRAADPGLWIVVLSPDPSAQGVRQLPSAGTYVGLADGTVRTVPGPTGMAVAAQNQLRAKYNLPPLPDPATVTHALPGRAGMAASRPAEQAVDDPQLEPREEAER